MITEQMASLKKGNYKALARVISLIENEVEGYEQMLSDLELHNTPIIGITGPPGAGKSTITDALIYEITEAGKTVGVICVDPSSPFNHGALLGDRIRMSEWYTHPSVFIRSLATRGSLGGLHPMVIEITDVMKAATFDYIIVETVGVGQSEVEIAGLADATIVVVVPEAGDEIQAMKAGLMEIADIFVVNKSDRPDADIFIKNLKMMSSPAFQNYEAIDILKTVATEKKGIAELFTSILKKIQQVRTSDKKYFLLAEKAYHLIQKRRMRDISRRQLFNELKQNKVANLYEFLQNQKIL